MRYDLPTTERRKKNWYEELRADANASYLISISIVEKLQRVYKLPQNDALNVGFVTAFSGVDAALHALTILEKCRFGDVTLEIASTHRSFSDHPPSIYRRDISSQVSKSIILGSAAKNSWEEIRFNIASMIIARNKLIEKFFTERHDFVQSLFTAL